VAASGQFNIGSVDVSGLNWGGASWWQVEPNVQPGDIVLIDLASIPNPQIYDINPPIDPAVTPSGAVNIDPITCIGVQWQGEWLDLGGGISQLIEYPVIVSRDPGVVSLLDINWILPGPHNYAIVNKVTSNPQDGHKAWQGLLRHAAPNQNGQAYNGNVVQTQFGPVEQRVDAASYTVTNTTMQGHLLHPGQIQRSVVQGADGLYILTVGTGEGWLGDINTLLSPLLWGAMDQQIITYIATQ
jgi:hypothetical protein